MNHVLGHMLGLSFLWRPISGLYLNLNLILHFELEYFKILNDCDLILSLEEECIVGRFVNCITVEHYYSASFHCPERTAKFKISLTSPIVTSQYK